MKIAIDISPVIYGTGVSVYTKELVKNLLVVDKKNEYVLFGGSLRRSGEIKEFTKSLKGTNFKVKVLPIAPTVADIMWNCLRFPKIESLIGEVDVFHSSDWAQPPTEAFKVTTVHDLSPLLFPKETHPKIYSTHKRRLNIAKEEVDKIIVPSKATKADLVKFEFDANKIVVIPEAASSFFKPASKERVAAVKRKYNISGDYIFTLGITPRKNIVRLIKAHEIVRKNFDITLVVAGRATKTTIKQDKNRILTGHLSDRDLVSLYSGALALVYPSLSEGFGLPILQAMAVGTPVVTSNVSSMSEVAENAAVLVDPKSVDSIANGIKTAMKQREDLRNKGYKQIKKFSWERTAKETLKVYKSHK